MKQRSGLQIARYCNSIRQRARHGGKRGGSADSWAKKRGELTFGGGGEEMVLQTNENLPHITLCEASAMPRRFGNRGSFDCDNFASNCRACHG